MKLRGDLLARSGATTAAAPEVELHFELHFGPQPEVEPEVEPPHSYRQMAGAMCTGLGSYHSYHSAALPRPEPGRHLLHRFKGKL